METTSLFLGFNFVSPSQLRENKRGNGCLLYSQETSISFWLKISLFSLANNCCIIVCSRKRNKKSRQEKESKDNINNTLVLFGKTKTKTKTRNEDGKEDSRMKPTRVLSSLLFSLSHQLEGTCKKNRSTTNSISLSSNSRRGKRLGIRSCFSTRNVTREEQYIR